MTPNNRASRRSQGSFTDTQRITLLEGDLDYLDELKEGEHKELWTAIEHLRDEISKLKWWMIGNFGGVSMAILLLGLNLAFGR